MIIEGTKHNNAGNLARYLLGGKEGEQARVHELRGAATDDLLEALTDWELCARTLTKGHKVMYHTHIRLPDGERMNDAQWMHTIEELEQRLGLANCPRAIVEHAAGDERHFHIAWSRLDPTTERCAALSMDRKQYHETARWAEKEFSLSPVDSIPDWYKGKKNRRMTDAQLKAFSDKKINKEELQRRLKYAWENTVDGAEFQAAVKELGYDIERGDKRAYVINLDGLKQNPVRLLRAAGVEMSEEIFRERMRSADMKRSQQRTDTERDKAPERKPALMPTGKLSTAVSMRKAKHLIRSVADNAINDEPAKPAKTGFTTRTRSGPQPKLKMKTRHSSREIM